MDPDAAQRYLRQIALPEIGPDGQARIAAAVVAVAAEAEDDVTAEVVARYLAAGGVGTLRLIGGGDAIAAATFEANLRASNPDAVIQARAWPADGDAWVAALEGADLVVRAGFDDDPMLRAAVRLGIPAVLLRAVDDRVELLALREQGPCPHVDLAIAPRRAQRAPAGASAVVAATLGAAEALLLLVRRPREDRSRATDATATRAPRVNARARHLVLPLSPSGDGGGAPRVQEIPWSPECFACGGGAVEMVLS
jgi:hypothetical protein